MQDSLTIVDDELIKQVEDWIKETKSKLSNPDNFKEEYSFSLKLEDIAFSLHYKTLTVGVDLGICIPCIEDYFQLSIYKESEKENSLGENLYSDEFFNKISLLTALGTIKEKGLSEPIAKQDNKIPEESDYHPDGMLYVKNLGFLRYLKQIMRAMEVKLDSNLKTIYLKDTESNKTIGLTTTEKSLTKVYLDNFKQSKTYDCLDSYSVIMFCIDTHAYLYPK